MVAGCTGTRSWDFSDSEEVFLQGGLSLLKVILPLAICFLLWRRYVMNKSVEHGSVSILGLSDRSIAEQRTESCVPVISTWILLLYVTVSIVTFKLGLLSVLAYDFLRDVLLELLGP
jgi:hypothetical protein